MTEALCPACGTDEPAPALCQRCTTRLRSHLATIGKLRPQLGAFLRPGSGKPGPRAGKPGSRPPANLDVLSATDVRSRIRINWDTGELSQDHVTPVDAELIDLARWVLRDRHFSAPLRETFDAIRIINISFEWIIRSHKAAYVLAVLESCATQLRRAVKESREPSVGRCTVTWDDQLCDGQLALVWDGPLPADQSKHASPTGIVCRRCGDAWDIADLSAVGQTTPLQLWETPPRIAEMLGMSERTLRHWISTKKVRRNGLGMVCHGDVWRILNDDGSQPRQTTGSPLPA